MDPATLDGWKHAAALAAVAEVEPGMLVGLGTGTTAAHAIAALGERAAGGLKIETVATSERTAAAARAAGLTVLDFAAIATIDLCIDGVDEIDPQLRAIKGAGGAMLREKIVASSARRMIAIADGSKEVAQLGARPVPIEVLPFARRFVEERIAEMGAVPTLRMGAAGAAWRSDQGNMVLDCAFGLVGEPAVRAAALSAIPGVLGHGLFVDEIDMLYLGAQTGVVQRDRIRLR